VTALIIAVSSALFSIYIAFKPESPDPETLCTSVTPPHHYLVLVDRTDIWTPQRGLALKQELLRIKSNTKKGEKLSIYEFGGATDADVKQLFSLCNPGRAEDALFIYEGEVWAEKEYQKRFGQPLNVVISKFEKPKESAKTYLVQAISEVIASPDFGPDIAGRELLIFSDMRQNTVKEGFSFYRGENSIGMFKNFADKFLDGDELNEIQVRVFQIRTNVNSARSIPYVRNTWEKYFDSYQILYEWESI